MVRYYGRARTRTGSVNTNQLGLKMSGCPSTVGREGRIARYMGRRVDCMMGLCKPIRYHEVLWPRTRMRNQPPFCQAHATKCLAAAGGVGTNHNIPYYRIPKRGESGCTPTPTNHTLLGTYTLTALAGIDGLTNLDEVGYMKAGSTSDLYYGGSSPGGSLSGPDTAIIQSIATVDFLGPNPNGFLLITDYIPGFADERNTPFSRVSVIGNGLNFTLDSSDFTAPGVLPAGNPTFVIYITGGIPKVSGQFVSGSTYSVTIS